jgi:multiple antibiotic resistance protein
MRTSSAIERARADLAPLPKPPVLHCTFLVSFFLTTAFLVSTATAQVANTGAVAALEIGPRKVFVMLFLMLGPIKILMPFVGMTKDMDAALRSRLARRAILFSAAAIALAGLFGRSMMANFNVSLPVLALTGGLVLFLVALQTVLQQSLGYTPSAPQGEVQPGLHLAFSPLAFPIIVTPYGIAAVIVFATIANGDHGAELMLAVIVLAILAMDWAAMVFAELILRWIGTTLQVFAVILGVAQIAIGLQVIFHSLHMIGVFPERMG